ncbi:MAG: glycoside hydrolase family 3 C-terminal domain-containing protein [Treponema sp.]|nr:glycoside hydrolase family 3 C-terminal domain-containing protein [Treponema sp.]
MRIVNNCVYKDSGRLVHDRVTDLIKTMTLNQKIRQLAGIRINGLPEPEMIKDGIGGVNMIFISEAPREIASQIRECQKRITAATPQGIPALFHCEALSGPLQPGCAAFPSSLNLGASFAPDLVRGMAERTRSQLLNLGIRHALSPVFDLARDFRFGRTNEHYSSDPTLTAAMACAFVKGLQGDDLREGIAATGKHFIGYSFAEGGLHMARVQTDWRDLRENFAKPFEAAIRMANLRCVMNAYSEYNGLPVCASKELLTDLLRDDLGFQGLVVSDYSSIDMLLDRVKIAENRAEAAIQTLTAGLDMEFPNPYCFGPDLREAVKQSRLEESYINRALERVLTLKFELGLFDEQDRGYIEINNSEHDRYSAVLSEKSITLTKNSGILPLKDRNMNIAVIGPAGNSLLLFNGTYTFSDRYESEMMISLGRNSTMEGIKEKDKQVKFEGDRAGAEAEISAATDELIRKEHPGVKTMYEALKEIFPNTEYVRGCGIIGEDESGFEKAIETARKANVVIMAIGGKNGWNHTCTSGEGIDTSNINLPGIQAILIQRIYAVNSSIIIVHTDNKPLIDPWVYDHAPAIIEGWLPGIFGGNAIAGIIAGTINPGGKLPVDIPRNTGQQPVYYYQHRGCRSEETFVKELDNASDADHTSQLPFGYGLSYTNFKYSGGMLSADTGKDDIPVITVSLSLTNTGEMRGDEVVQLYGIDEIASIIRPQKELLGFKRVTLNPGETRRVRFTFRLDQMAFINPAKKWVIEKGSYCFYIGKGANNSVFTAEYIQEKTMLIDRAKRGFYAEAKLL